MNVVAVYGSLLSGFGNHRLLEQSNFLGQSEITGFEMYSLGGFPVICPVENKSVVQAEIYQVDDTTMARLDRLEGYPNFYNRQEVSVQVAGKVESAWVYFMSNPPNYAQDKIETGSWRDYRNVSNV